MLPESTRAVETKSIQCRFHVRASLHPRTACSKPRPPPYPAHSLISYPAHSVLLPELQPRPCRARLAFPLPARPPGPAVVGAPQGLSLSGRLSARLLLHCPSRLPQDSSPSSSFLGLLTSGLPGGGMEGTPGSPLPPSRQPVLALWPRAAPSSYTPARCLEDVETPPPLSRREDSDKK